MAPFLSVELIDGESGLPMHASIRLLNLTQDSLSWFVNWLPEMFNLAGQPACVDSDWNIAKIWEHAFKRPDSKVLILDADDDIQGYSVLNVSGHRGIDGHTCTCIRFLAAAPWNRRERGGERVYHGSGQALLASSIIAGYIENGSSALELNSLPSAEAFYRKQGMIPTGNKDEDGLLQYRFDEQEAQAFVTHLMNQKKIMWRK